MEKIIALFIVDFMIAFIVGFIVGKINHFRCKENFDETDDDFIVNYDSFFGDDDSCSKE